MDTVDDNSLKQKKSKLAHDMENILRHSQFSEEPTENSQETNAERWLGKPSVHHI